MDNSSIGFFSRWARRPWYWFWKALEARQYRGREYSLQVPFGRRVHTPWFAKPDGSLFSEALSVAQEGGYVSQSPDRAYLLCRMVQHASLLGGDLAECGVFRGGSAHLMAETLARLGGTGRQLHLFDTFCGVPDFADAKRDYHRAGDYGNTSLDAVQARLAAYGGQCRFHPGVIPESFSGIDLGQRFSLVNVDVDLHPTTLACCHWFWPRLVPGGVMIFNDYGFFPYRNSTRLAVDTFFMKHPEEPIILPSGQAMVIKTNSWSDRGVAGCSC
ncbi:TylF/MycF/NovP-related O-methyltransferase [Holophaga foetida]|uniref:TylF/MycF/NovP-related O-methyltransferase n=1 Tax=Holophaga foetida TaxID=35839 RepID=UPI000247504B|nr:TylF/MycF/NovP-related O-methyltransferase [Holophaga foetida]